jgi:hypothetical protein
MLAGNLRTSGFETVTLDAGGAVAAQGSRTHSKFASTRLQNEFRAAGDNRTRRREIVRRAADRIDERIAALKSRSERAHDRYNADRISARTYLRELAVIDRSAEELRDAVDLLSTYSSAVGEPVSPDRIPGQKARLLPLEGPVRSRALAAMTGESPPTRVYVATSEEGVVLATIEREAFVQRYIREAYVPGARQPGGIDRFAQGFSQSEAPARAQDRAAELYPWTFENKLGSSRTYIGSPYLPEVGVYPVIVEHPQAPNLDGDLRIFLDGTTRDVFREIQYKDLSRVPTRFASGNTSDGIRLRVNRTRSGGPMLVSVTDASTGDPLSATVRVDGEPVGSTDTDGERWVVAPRTSAEVTVTRGDTNVSTFLFTENAPAG